MARDVQITFDCADPAGLAAFWAEALGYRLQDPPAGFDSWEQALDAMGVPPERRNGASGNPFPRLGGRDGGGELVSSEQGSGEIRPDVGRGDHDEIARQQPPAVPSGAQDPDRRRAPAADPDDTQHRPRRIADRGVAAPCP